MPQPIALDPRLAPLAEGLTARDTVAEVLDGYVDADGYWWLKFRLDTTDPGAWDEVQQLAWLYNNVFAAEPEPVLLRPLAIAPHATGVPGASLHWSLECLAPDYTPERALDTLLTTFVPPRLSASGRPGRA